MKTILNSVIFLWLFLVVCCSKQDKSDWIDPTNMITFDPVLKKNIQQSDNADTTKQQQPKVEDDDDSYIKKSNDNLVDLKSKENSLQQFCQKSPNSADVKPNSMNENDLIFMKRFIAFYTRKLAEVSVPVRDTEYEVIVRMNQYEWSILEQFNKNSSTVSLQAVLHHLEHSFVQVLPSKQDREQKWRFKFEDYFHVQLNDFALIVFVLLMVFAILTSEFVSKISWGRQFGRMLVLMFILSYGWTYTRHYKEAVAKKEASFVNVPDRCKNELNRSFDQIFYWFHYMFSTTKDPCAVFHESHLIEPIFTVSPFKILAATISEFMLEPLGHMGSAFSIAFKNMFAELPVQLWVPAFIFIILAMITFLLLLSICSGYTWNLHLPFWTGLEIAPFSIRHHEELVQNYRAQIQNLERQVVTLQNHRNHNIPAIEVANNNPITESWTTSVWNYFSSSGNSNGEELQTRADNHQQLSENEDHITAQPTDFEIGHNASPILTPTLPYPSSEPPPYPNSFAAPTEPLYFDNFPSATIDAEDDSISFVQDVSESDDDTSDKDKQIEVGFKSNIINGEPQPTSPISVKQKDKVSKQSKPLKKRNYSKSPEEESVEDIQASEYFSAAGNPE